VTLDRFQVQLVEDHARLARPIASQVWRQSPGSMELEELISVANSGLVTAAKRASEVDQSRPLPEQARAAGMTVGELQRARASAEQRPLAIDAGEAEPQEASVEGSVVTASLLDSLGSVFDALAPHLQAVLALHYYGELEVRDVAVHLGVTESRASHLHTEAVLAVLSALERESTVRVSSQRRTRA
jgi:RNA polymerase sigma factor (sigma-70 family)